MEEGPDTHGSARVDGPIVSSVRRAQPVRTAGLLHASRLGMEEQSQRSVRELASPRLLPAVLRTNPVERVQQDGTPSGLLRDPEGLLFGRRACAEVLVE